MIEIFQREATVLIASESEFVTFSRYTNSEGFGSAVFSFPVTPKIADRIESSKIIRVEKASTDGTLVFRKLPFYTVDKAIEIFTEIIEHEHEKSNI